MKSSSKLKVAHLRLGRYGERVACRLLRELGLEILLCNYSCKYGEIDIVARDNDQLCFVEVKTRRRLFYGKPADAVGHFKRLKIIKTAKQYLRQLGNPKILYRYDIIELIIPSWQVKYARYWDGAFTDERNPFGDSLPDLVIPNDIPLDLSNPKNWQIFNLDD